MGNYWEGTKDQLGRNCELFRKELGRNLYKEKNKHWKAIGGKLRRNELRRKKGGITNQLSRD